MRRIDTANTIDLAPGKKGFRGKNTAAGVPGTPLGDTWLNDIQEELANAIEGSGLPLAADRDQLLQVLRRQMEFVTVVSVTAVVPGAPANGDRHLIAAGAGGAWAGQAGRLAIWNGAAWTFVTLPIGARVIDRATPVTSPNRELRQLAALTWTPVQANTTDWGHARRATAAETSTGADINAYVTPQDLIAAGTLPLGTLPWPEVFTADRLAAVSVASSAGNGGTITVTGGEIVQIGEDVGGGLGRSRRFALPAAGFAALAINSTYYVRARVTGGALEIYQQRGTDTDAEPVGGVGTPGAAAGGGFDTTRLDILLARVVTGAAGTTPTITRLANAQRLIASAVRTSRTRGSSWSSLASGGHQLSATINWARTPLVSISNFDVDAETDLEALNGITRSATRYQVIVFVQGYMLNTGAWSPNIYVSGAVTTVMQA